MLRSIFTKEPIGNRMLNRSTISSAIVPLFAILMAVAGLLQQASAELSFEPSWQLPTYAEVRARVLAWLDEEGIDAEAKDAVRTLWPTRQKQEPLGTELLDRTVKSIVMAVPQANELYKACNSPYKLTSLPDGEFLRKTRIAPLVKNNLLLYLARWQAQRGLYDEVIDTLSGLKPEDVVDPGSLLFYRMVAHHQVVHPDESRAALVQLLEHEDALPQRYRHVAQLLDHDLRGLKDDSLDHIARRMNDVRRRLELGRAGDKVQMVEKDILDSLEKLIEKMEQQSQQSSSGGGGSGSQGGGGSPMQDSQLPSMQAPMQVDQKDIGNKSGWGDLPPKEREEALQQIGRDFPAHYRELIEQYFRELAAEGDSSDK